MIKEIFEEYKELGLIPIGVEWDVEKKQPVSHRNWSDVKGLNFLAKHNAIMIKTQGKWAALDFDIKNTNNKDLFAKWQQYVNSIMPDIWDKVYIEKTRNAGYHVWLNYPNLSKKLSLAQSDIGSEVIALYASGPLVYTYPTPGYEIFSGSMADVEPLTNAEYSVLIESAQYFNEYKPNYDPNLKAVSYPMDYQDILAAFDKQIPDEIFETILNEIGLVPLPGYHYKEKDKFAAYWRQGSTSKAISAKVYYHSKRVLIFSSSLIDYPNWHNRDSYDGIWSLPPSFLLFYKMDRDWIAVIEYVKAIIESAGLDIEIPKETINPSDFPIHVFGDTIANSILAVSKERSLPVQFVATAGLWTISALAGARYHSEFNGEGKNILFCLLIAPVSVGKTPAFKVMCETPLKQAQENDDKSYLTALRTYEEEKDVKVKGKKAAKRPIRYIPIAVDGTTEGYTAKSMVQPNGIGVYQDEAESLLNAGSYKANNDAVSYFTTAFAGGRNAQIRADETKERVVPNMNLNLLMGTQPSRMANIFTQDKLDSGFASRFLMVEAGYTKLNEDVDPFSAKKEMCQEWTDIVNFLYHAGMDYNANGNKVRIEITPEAKDLYRFYYRSQLSDANQRILNKAESYIMGSEAKMSAYFPRLTQILAILNNPNSPKITEVEVENGFQLYRYYADTSVKIITRMHKEVEAGLPAEMESLYQALPNDFTTVDAKATCKMLNLSERKFEIWMRRKDFSGLFRKVKHGFYAKN